MSHSDRTVFKPVWRCWWPNHTGAALIEFVFVLPFLLLMVLGGVELVRYILIVQKVDKAAYAIGNVVAQTKPAQIGVVDGIDATQLDNILALYPNLLRPYGTTGSPKVRVMSVRQEAGSLSTKWDVTRGGDPGVPDMPTGMLDGENAIIVQVSYDYVPPLQGTLNGLGFTISPATVMRRAYLHQRNGDLICLPPAIATLYTECWPASVVNQTSRCYYRNPSGLRTPYCGIYYNLDGTVTVDTSPCDGSASSPPAGWIFC